MYFLENATNGTKMPQNSTNQNFDHFFAFLVQFLNVFVVMNIHSAQLHEMRYFSANFVWYWLRSSPNNSLSLK